MNRAKVRAEWDKAEEILVSTPGYEMFNALLHYEASFFQAPCNSKIAAEEHGTFKRILEDEFGVKVHSLDEVLISDTSRLKDLAKVSLNYEIQGGRLNAKTLDENEKRAFNELKEYTLDKLSSEDLLRIVFERPTKVLSYEGNQLVYNHDRINPITSHYFQRDPQIVTDKGPVLGAMKNGVRKAEVSLVGHALEILGYDPLYLVNSKGTLEGGDYIPAGDFALLGVGLRTNDYAIEQLFENDVFGFDEIAIVRDPYKNQDEMHLDTYFNFIDEDKALILKDRLNADCGGNPNKTSWVEIYDRGKEGYEKRNTIEEKISFQDYLKSKKVELIPVEKEIQMNYGINILTLDKSSVIAVNGVADGYKGMLEKNGVKVREIDAYNLTRGYGGPHCMTQTLRRCQE